MSYAPDIEKILNEQNKKIDEQTFQIEKLTGLVDTLLKTIRAQPEEISLSTLCHDMGKSRQTLYAHILNNYEPEVDFRKAKNSIMIKSHVVPLIKGYYETKQK